MDYLISVSFGELTLKGDNRKDFENRIIRKIKKAIESFEIDEFYKEQGKVYIKANREFYKEMIEKIKKVFGIFYICEVLRCKKDICDIEQMTKKLIFDLDIKEKKTFKVFINRVDKKFTPKSPELSKMLGGVVLKNFGNFLKVDVHNPQIHLFVDVKEYVYGYVKRYKGFGGLPIGSSGRGLLLLSGGIDSPVAGFVMGKRGMEIGVIHFHSYPFTSERAEEKVKDLAKILSEYVGKFTMTSINLFPIQKEIASKCPEKEITILGRIFMMKIAEKLAVKQNYNALVTGESLGQVASQTIQGLTVVDKLIDISILRPLIAMDKTEIIDIARTIGTYETSILPFEDCCTVFLPKHPVTKPKIEDITKSLSLLDVDSLIKEAISNKKVYNIKNEQ
ncbi:hypothetical protein HMPREF3188_00475 [Tissierellia bacterium KA00581]|nr:hypothetical protein HMPREF3188_00475 [Tissierellia bacterium KA00581]